MLVPRYDTHGGYSMVDQLPNLGREKEMLGLMGMSSIDDLFADIPEAVRMTEELPLPPPQSEEEIIADARRLLGANVAFLETPYSMVDQLPNLGREKEMLGELPWRRTKSKLCS